MTTTNGTPAVESRHSREDIDLMSLDELATLASRITSVVLATGYMRTVTDAAEGLMRSAGELGESAKGTNERRLAHALELMAILRTPQVLEQAAKRIEARLWRSLDVPEMMKQDDHVLVRLIPAMVDLSGGVDEFVEGVVSRAEPLAEAAYQRKLQSICEEVDATLAAIKQGKHTPPA